MTTTRTRCSAEQYEFKLKQAKAAYNNDRVNRHVKMPMKYYIQEHKLGNPSKEPLLKYFHDEITVIECHNLIIEEKKKWHEKKKAEQKNDTSYIYRMRTEYNELVDRSNKLVIFMQSDKFDTLSKESRCLMIQQQFAMRSYADVLKKRIYLEEKLSLQ